MLDPDLLIAIYAPQSMGTLNAKMAEGVLRYGRNRAVAVIDPAAAGQRVRDLCPIDSDVPIVATLNEAVALGARVLVLGTAPSGGRLPQDWIATLSSALAAGLSIVNGLHDRLNDRFGAALKPGQFIWDVRVPQGEKPSIAMGRAAAMTNTRVLMVGTDMAIGKMTAALEVHHWLVQAGHDAAFLATGQTGIVISGAGIPLDAVPVDYAAAMVERMVLEAAAHDIVLIEGQGSLLHPGSTATLPLMRGSCANRLVLCHRAGMDRLDTSDSVVLGPPVDEVVALNEMVACAAGALTPAKVVALSLNTRDLDERAARREIDRLSDWLGLPVGDPVRFGAGPIAQAVLAVET